MKPTVDQVKARLRLDGDEWDGQIEGLVESCHAEMLAYLDRPVHEVGQTPTEATSISANAALVNGQILLIGAYLNSAGSKEGEKLRETAYAVLRPHRLLGA